MRLLLPLIVLAAVATHAQPARRRGGAGDLWRRQDGITRPALREELPKRDAADGTSVVRETSSGGKDGSEVVVYLIRRHSSKEIAQRLGLSPRTAEAHRAELMERLDLHDVAGLVRFAVKVGLVTPEE